MPIPYEKKTFVDISLKGCSFALRLFTVATFYVPQESTHIVENKNNSK